MISHIFKFQKFITNNECIILHLNIMQIIS